MIRVTACGEVVSLGHITSRRRTPGGRRSAPQRGVEQAAGEGSPARAHLAARCAGLDDPSRSPAPVPNRCVRGFSPLPSRGIDAFYPGRDLVTAKGRVLGALAFDVDARGVLLFEVVLSIERGFDALAALLDSADAGGEIVAELWPEERTTSLASLLGRDLAVEDLADLLRRGFEDEFPIVTRPAQLADDDRSGIEALARPSAPPAGVHGRRRRVRTPRDAPAQTRMERCCARRGRDERRAGGDFIATRVVEGPSRSSARAGSSRSAIAAGDRGGSRNARTSSRHRKAVRHHGPVCARGRMKRDFDLRIQGHGSRRCRRRGVARAPTAQEGGAGDCWRTTGSSSATRREVHRGARGGGGRKHAGPIECPSCERAAADVGRTRRALLIEGPSPIVFASSSKRWRRGRRHSRGGRRTAAARLRYFVPTRRSR